MLPCSKDSRLPGADNSPMLVSRPTATVQAITRRAARSIEDTLSRALEEPGQGRRAAELLDELAALLLPTDLREGSQPAAATAAAEATDRDPKDAAAQVHRSLLT